MFLNIDVPTNKVDLLIVFFLAEENSLSQLSHVFACQGSELQVHVISCLW